MIYGHLLTYSQPPEFWPETGHFNRDFHMRIVVRHRTRHKLHLQLLRTCKVVNSEAAEIFYGKNEFRFSGINGCVIASAFVFTINSYLE